MPPFKKQSKSLDHFDVQDFKPFKPQRVVSFKLYAQEQRSRLTTLYPFLTQEQIYLKVKDKWNRLENEHKQNYTKAVLYATPSRKTNFKVSPGKLLQKDGQSEISSKAGFEAAVTSKAKVADWLNDPKQKCLTDQRNKVKTYDGTSYSLPYDVPTVIDPTPTKQPGILRSSSEKKENKKTSETSKRRTRVSFSPNSGSQGKKAISQTMKITKPSDTNEKTKTCLESRFTNINEAFNFEDKTTLENSPLREKNTSKKHGFSESKSIQEQPRKSVNKYDTQGIVFKESSDEELFTTPEMAKLPLQEISKAPKKRKSVGKRGSSGLQDKVKKIPGKAKKIKTSPESKLEVSNSNNNNSSIVSDVFGKKVWAASTYSRKAGSRKMTPEKTVEQRKEKNSKKNHKDSFIQEKGSLTGPFQNDSDEENSGDFIRNERGLLVGPIGCDFDEMDDQRISDESDNDVDMDDWHAPQKEEIKKLSSRRKSASDEMLNKKPVVPLGRKLIQESYTCDFDDTSLSSSRVNLKKPLKQKNKAKMKSVDEVVEFLMETSPQKEKNAGSQRKTTTTRTPRLISLCKDFEVEKPVSPIVSDTGDNNFSGSVTDDTASPTPAVSGSNPTLMKVLLKMKQITSPNILDIQEASPRLLSPTLSGITELSSLSTETSATKDNEDGPDCSLSRKSRKQPVCDVEEPMEGEVFPGTSRTSRRSSRPTRESGENILCRMFQDMTPPDTQHKFGRRLVSSNKRQRRSNFDDMFEEKDIFS